MRGKAGLAQSQLFGLDHIGMEDGLPARMIYGLCQDQEGFLWMSSQFGIHRYDGKNFKTWTKLDLGIDGRYPLSLAVDHQNRIWLLQNAREGSSYFFGILDTARNGILKPENLFPEIFGSGKTLLGVQQADKPGHILLWIQGGEVYEYDGDFRKVCRINFVIPHGIGRWATAADGVLWGSEARILHRVKPDGTIESFSLPVEIKGLIHKIFPYREGAWVTVVNKMKTQRFFCSEGGWEARPLEGCVPPEDADLVFISDSTMWISGGEKITVLDQNCRVLKEFDIRDRILSPNRGLVAFHRFRDALGNIWISSENGLFRLIESKTPFHHQSQGRSIRGMLLLGDTLWQGGSNDAVWTQLKTGEQGKFPGDAAPQFFTQDRKGNVIGLISSRAFLLYYDRSKKEMQQLNLKENLSPVIAFRNKLNGNLIFATHQGLYLVDEDSFAEEDVRLSPLLRFADLGIKPFIVSHAYQNAKGIWLCSNRGLYLFDPETKRLADHFSAEEGYPWTWVQHLHEDAAGNFWVATRNKGLFKWNVESGEILRFSTDNGLSNNNIYAVYEDDFGILWLPSDFGLMAMEKESGRTRVFLPQNGVANEEFNGHGHYKSKDGRLFFGGLNGITYFDPAVVHTQTQTTPAPFLLTEALLLEEGESKSRDILPEVQNSRELRIPPGGQVLRLQFSLLDYKNSAFHQYAYRIKGLQENWIHFRENALNLNNLPYGEYVLQIKARASEGDWNPEQIEVALTVERPFYLQTWFLALVGLFVVALVILLVRLRLRGLRRDRIRLEQEVASRTQKIAAQAEELKELDRVKSQFFANITHEFRTPLTLVIGPAEQLAGQVDPGPVREGIRRIARNARHLLGLINQLLDLSKLEDRSMQLDLAHGDLVAFTRELVEAFEPFARQKQVQLRFASDMETWETHFDKDKWSKVVNNLLSNSIKFSEREGRVLVKLLKVRQGDKDWIELSVEDRGIGIDAEKLDRIFDRFYQVNSASTRTHEGTGIGLALVQELVAFQGGKIRVSSQLGEGTTFVVQIPVRNEAVGEEGERRQPDSSPHHSFRPVIRNESPAGISVQDANPEEKLSLLIIEDHPDLVAYIRSCIDEERYHIYEAEDGEAGLALALEKVPDLILSDVMMPRKDGFEVVSEIRRHRATSHIPVILLTAKASLESRLEGLKRGADAYLTKPFSPEELTLRIDKLIELRQQLRNRYKNGSMVTAPLESFPLFEAEDKFMEDLRSFIDENLINPDLKVEAISAHLGVSRSQLYRKLKTISDIGISDMVRQARCEKALVLIQNRDLSLSEIAYEVGFSSPSHFTRSFKKTFGKPPSELQ